MSQGLSIEAKELIRQKVDIVELVESYNLQLRREGRAYKALCPWHNDSRPSLQVNPERQSFKCWVCDIGGDIFSFVMKMENVSFPEAIAILAERAGVALQGGKGKSALSENKQFLYQAMAWAEEQFHEHLLQSPEGEPAREYLRGRGLTDASIARFRLGFASMDWEWLLKRAQGTRYSPQMLETIGLAARRQSGGYYDRFRGRVLFPIRDSQGRPVGVGGRVLPGADGNLAKYINSPETPLFTKSQLVYGLELARKPIREAKTALVMEGYTDCIVAHQQGFDNAVAVLGTALGERHIKLLKHIDERVRVVLVLDGDEAGRRRTNEVLTLFVAENVDLRVATLPGDKDPCDFLLQDGPEAFRRYLDGALDALEHAVQTEAAGIDVRRDVHASSQALGRLIACIAHAPRLRGDTTIEDRLREEKILQRLAFRFQAPEEDVRARLTAERRQRSKRSGQQTIDVAPRSTMSAPRRLPGNGAGASAPPPEGEASAAQSASFAPISIDPWERELLSLALSCPEMLDEVLAAVPPEELTAPMFREILALARDLRRAGEIVNVDRLLLAINEPRLQSCVVDLDEQGRTKSSVEASAALSQCLASFRRRRERREARAQLAELKAGGLDSEREQAMLLEFIQQQRKHRGISPPTEG